RYICLSHCWGSKQPLQTTASNIKDYQRNIPWDVVPVVYREAIEICWKLGVEYIWIDSLCIIQDSKEDWVQESQKMCDIYANSYQEFIFMRRKTSHWDTDNELNQLATEWPLKTRAWAFQEHMLSPRLVQFTHTDIIWQCLRGTTCDCSGANSLGETALTYETDKLPALSGLAHKFAQKRPGAAYLAGAWKDD
ncbi:heterokaryon incompatibility protein-domain-containing protein, partial [Immersiella caudata]